MKESVLTRKFSENEILSEMEQLQIYGGKTPILDAEGNGNCDCNCNEYCKCIISNEECVMDDYCSCI